MCHSYNDDMLVKNVTKEAYHFLPNYPVTRTTVRKQSTAAFTTTANHNHYQYHHQYY